MESKAQVNCSCSLISIKYKLEQPQKTQSFSYNNKKENRDSPNLLKKSKISLSRSTSKNYKQPKQRQINLSRPISNCYTNISNKFGRTSFDSKIYQSHKIKKKFLAIHQYQQSTKETAQDKYHKDIFTNQNINFLSSSETINGNIHNKHRNTEQPLLESYQMRRIEEQRPERFQRCERGDRSHFRNDVRRTAAYESQNIKYNNPFAKQLPNEEKKNIDNKSGRRIRPLKQLQCRNVQSSGKMSSQNRISMVVTSGEDLKDLQGLASLIQKTSSTAFRMSRNSQIMI